MIALAVCVGWWLVWALSGQPTVEFCNLWFVSLMIVMVVCGYGARRLGQD